MRWLILIFHFLPQNLLSFLTGVVVRWRLPEVLRRPVLKGFIKAFGIDFSEARGTLDDYASIEDVFTRALKPDLRPVVPPVCSPADGFLAASEPVEKGRAIQAKGLDYDLNHLLYGETADAHPEKGWTWAATVYLAPHNYHRVHAPVRGRLEAIRYIPGELWPVGRSYVARVPRLFVRNERLVFEISLPDGGGRVALAMVGAFNVGRISTPFWNGFATNDSSRQWGCPPALKRFTPPQEVDIGEEIGTFMLGSTVVMAFDDQALSGIRLAHERSHRPILMGQSLLEVEGGAETARDEKGPSGGESS